MKKGFLLPLLAMMALSTAAVCSADENGADHVFTIASSCDIGAELNPHAYHSGAALYALNYVYDPLVVYQDGETIDYKWVSKEELIKFFENEEGIPDENT